MRVETPINHSRLIQALNLKYGLGIEGLKFLGEGMVGAYKASSKSQDYFLKIFPNTAFGREAAIRMKAEHRLLAALHQHKILERIPTPLPDISGKTHSAFEDLPLALYRFIEGHTIWGEEQKVLGALAKDVARLHAGFTNLELKELQMPAPIEDFELPFATRLTEQINGLRHLPKNAKAGLRALQDLMLPRQEEVLLLLARAKYFQSLARSKPRTQVVTHTDLHGGNLLLDPKGDLWLLDWETARIAPPEHDLWMFHENLEEFLAFYETQLGRTVLLDADLFGFYFYRRTLEDLAVDIQKIVLENTDDQQDREDLQIIDQHVIADWPNLSLKLERVQKSLTRRPSP